MSSARKRMSLFKAHNEIDRLRQQVMMLEHRCTCTPSQSLTVNQQLHAALLNVIRDLEMRSNMKLGDQRGVVDIGNGAYLQAKEALSVVESRKPEAAWLMGWEGIESAPSNEILLLACEFDGPGDWRIKCGYYDEENKMGWKVWGASWTPTRWMKMPPAPESAVLRKNGIEVVE